MQLAVAVVHFREPASNPTIILEDMVKRKEEASVKVLAILNCDNIPISIRANLLKREHDKRPDRDPVHDNEHEGKGEYDLVIGDDD